MIDTLVDSNVVIDLIAGNDHWEAWSHEALVLAAAEGSLVINTIVYAEVSTGFTSMEACEVALAPGRFEREPIPWSAAFLAGKVFATYRRRGGARRSPLPDFFIGAHAAVGGMRLLTRDPSRYRTYFPRIELIAPE